MDASSIRVLLQITRFDTSLISSLVVFIPLSLGGVGLRESWMLAMPVLLLSMAGFVLNDIHDHEKDIINHPERPIPRGEISKTGAMFLYFFLLAVALANIKIQVAVEHVFAYLVFAILMANYNFIVERFSYLKNFYVAATAVIPVCMVIQQDVLDRAPWILPLSIFVFVFGRELLMDVLDSEGDTDTLPSLIGEKKSVVSGFGAQLLAALSLIAFSESIGQKYIAGSMLIIAFAGLLVWRWKKERRKVVRVMKIQFLLGVAFMVA